MSTPAINLALRVRKVELSGVVHFQLVVAGIHAEDCHVEGVPNIVVFVMDDACVRTITRTVPICILDMADVANLQKITNKRGVS